MDEPCSNILYVIGRNAVPVNTTLCENKDFRRLYMRGKSFTDPVLVTYVMKNRTGVCRIGITTSKKIGNAVKRNRARRVIRAAYRSLAPQMTGSWDFVFVARVKTTFLKMPQVRFAMEMELKKAGIIQ